MLDMHFYITKLYNLLRIYKPYKLYKVQYQYHKNTMDKTFSETLFLLPEKPSNPIDLTVIAIHAVNNYLGLKLIGLREEDPDQEYEGLPEGWNQSDWGIYSLKYQDSEAVKFQFKIVSHQKSVWLNIFAVQVNDSSRLFSSQIDSSKLNFNRPELLDLKVYLNEVKNFLKGPEEKKQQQQPVTQTQSLGIERPSGLFWNQPRNEGPTLSGYGRSDLDPTGGFGFQGGSLLGPAYFNRFQGQQPGVPSNPLQVPPGARFDPFGPDPNINGSFNIWDQNQPRRNFPFQ